MVLFHMFSLQCPYIRSVAFSVGWLTVQADSKPISSPVKMLYKATKLGFSFLMFILCHNIFGFADARLLIVLGLVSSVTSN